MTMVPRLGGPEAMNVAFDELYTELRRLAARHMRREPARHTLQPTALVNEAYLRLMSGARTINDRHHFFALASQVMRRVLVDHARRKRPRKRGAELVHLEVDQLADAGSPRVDVVAVDEALTELATVDPRAVQVVELRFFGGHTDAEVADITGHSLASVRRDWAFARSWLRNRLRALADHRPEDA
ncbi:MAG: ECF-type sigma factor [Vicinamibacterales bacterium]